MSQRRTRRDTRPIGSRRRHGIRARVGEPAPVTGRFGVGRRGPCWQVQPPERFPGRRPLRGQLLCRYAHIQVVTVPGHRGGRASLSGGAPSGGAPSSAGSSRRSARRSPSGSRTSARLSGPPAPLRLVTSIARPAPTRWNSSATVVARSPSTIATSLPPGAPSPPTMPHYRGSNDTSAQEGLAGRPVEPEGPDRAPDRQPRPIRTWHQSPLTDEGG